MDAGYWLAPLKFLIDTFVTLYTLAIMLRLVLQLVRADYYNPISQFLLKVTQPVLRPLRRYIPSVGRIDLASIVLMLVLQTVKVVLVAVFEGVALPAFGAVFVLAAIQVLELLFDLYVGVILGSALLSWVSTHSNSPAVSLVFSLSEPVLDPARRFLPVIGGMDLSPIAVLMALELARMLLFPLLQQLFRFLS